MAVVGRISRGIETLTGVITVGVFESGWRKCSNFQITYIILCGTPRPRRDAESYAVSAVLVSAVKACACALEVLEVMTGVRVGSLR
jgi:hypothetical protein